MRSVPVCWVTFADDVPHRGYWDQGLLEDLFAGRLWGTSGGPLYVCYDNEIPATDGAVVVVPGRQNVDHVEDLNAAIADLEWVLLVVTGDEENVFPVDRVRHDNMKLWLMTPGEKSVADRYLGSGYPPGITGSGDKRLDWYFSGQITHPRRADCAEILNWLPGGAATFTQGFTQGVPQEEYWEGLSAAKVAPCPGGPISPDSFRLFEALELGCVPLADASSGSTTYPQYWVNIFGELPFPLVWDWLDLPYLMEKTVKAWPGNSNRIRSFWMNYKRNLAYGLDDDVRTLSGKADCGWTEVDEKITVLVPTSPIPSHPSTDIIEETIDSIRAQLPTAEIIVMVDGIRNEQKERRSDYDEYTRRLIQLCATKWSNVLPWVFDEHLHQGVATRRVMDAVRTPLVLFVEHDTPMIGEIDWSGVANAISTGDANLIRFHHEHAVHPEHVHLMLDTESVDVGGVPLLRTVQWSQRPHLASAGFYRSILESYFGWSSRTMIEDVMYGVLENHWLQEGVPGWEKLKVWMYAPEGDIKRSLHLDGRASDRKFSMNYQYDQSTVPAWAPAPGVRE